MRRLPPPPLPPWLARQLPFERYRLELGEHTMHVMESGQGRPVLCLHGNPTWGYLYRKVAQALTGSPVRVIMPDLIGLGLSSKPTDPAVHTLPWHAGMVGALIDALELDELVLVGQDWGGPIGLRAVADRPERVHGLVLLNTVIGPPRPGFHPTTFHRFARLPLLSELAFRGLGFPQCALWMAQGDRRSISGEVARAYRWPLSGMSQNVAPLALARMVPDGDAHPSIEPLQRCQDFVSTFTGPAALVWGLRDPILGSVLGWVSRQLPQATVTRTPAGHFLQEEVPDTIADAITRVAA